MRTYHTPSNPGEPIKAREIKLAVVEAKPTGKTTVGEDGVEIPVLQQETSYSTAYRVRLNARSRRGLARKGTKLTPVS